MKRAFTILAAAAAPALLTGCTKEEKKDPTDEEKKDHVDLKASVEKAKALCMSAEHDIGGCMSTVQMLSEAQDRLVGDVRAAFDKEYDIEAFAKRWKLYRLQGVAELAEKAHAQVKTYDVVQSWFKGSKNEEHRSKVLEVLASVNDESVLDLQKIKKEIGIGEHKFFGIVHHSNMREHFEKVKRDFPQDKSIPNFIAVVDELILSHSEAIELYEKEKDEEFEAKIETIEAGIKAATQTYSTSLQRVLA